MRSHCIALSLACAAIALLACQIGVAQDYRAKLQGIVTDSSQGAIAGATVTLLNANTGVTASKTTADNGLYVFDFVDPGMYTVTVEHPGFSKFTQTNVQVQVRGDVTVNAAGLGETHYPTQTAAWADYDNDGDLDQPQRTYP
jgi:hypothetical protein